MLDPGQPEDLLNAALTAFGQGADYPAALDRVPAPIYTTDADGLVTYWNQACVDFAGREPQLGTDRWCVTWQLHTMNGDPLPHDACPMAVAIKKKRAIRNEIAIAVRPNGERKAFRAYPTPVFNDEGTIIGAVNMLIDISDEQTAVLKEQAARCRRLAKSTNDQRTSEILRTMAAGYEETAAALQAKTET